MSHLGERLSALVDGELGAVDRDEALSHLAACSACRFEAEMLRQLKRRLHGLHEPEPAVDLMGRISAATEDTDTETNAAPDRRGEQPGGPGRGFLAALMRRDRSRGAGRDSFGSRPPLGTRRPIGGGLPQTRVGPGAQDEVIEPDESDGQRAGSGAEEPGPGTRRRDHRPGHGPDWPRSADITPQ